MNSCKVKTKERIVIFLQDSWYALNNDKLKVERQIFYIYFDI